jgi:hypothetical protein
MVDRKIPLNSKSKLEGIVLYHPQCWIFTVSGVVSLMDIFMGWAILSSIIRIVVTVLIFWWGLRFLIMSVFFRGGEAKR